MLENVYPLVGLGEQPGQRQPADPHADDGGVKMVGGGGRRR